MVCRKKNLESAKSITGELDKVTYGLHVTQGLRRSRSSWFE